MMRTIALVSLSLLLMMSVFAVAQEAPKAEVFGGYQLTHATTGVSGIDSFNLNGWNAAVSGYFHRYVGVTADFSGSYGSPFGVSSHMYTYMFGPTLRATNSTPFTPYAHVLFGGANFSASAAGQSLSDSGFAWAAGGGLDVKMARYASIRLGQFDFLQSKISNETQNNFRYSAGIVFHF